MIVQVRSLKDRLGLMKHSVSPYQPLQPDEFKKRKRLPYFQQWLNS